MQIQLSDHFDYRRLIRFTLPSIGMMLFTSIYGIVDGIFVSNFAGKEAFTAVNFILPFVMILGTLGFMLGTGGSALVAITMGEGNRERANRIFSLLVYFCIGSGILITVAGYFLIPPVARLLGAEGLLLENCIRYGHIVVLGNAFCMLQLFFQTFFITAEKPRLGLAATVAAGVANIVLDFLLVGVWGFGLAGAAWATVASQVVGGLFPILYFALPNGSLLRLGRTRLEGRVLLRACTNGSSELMSNVSMNLVAMVYNAQLIRYAGEDGVAAYGVLMYITMIFLAIFIGYSVGTAPVIGFHYGAENHQELTGILKRSAVIILSSSVAMCLLAELLGRPLSAIYVGYDQDLLALSTRAFRFYSLSYLFAGVAIYGSSFFTALGDGLTSALISFLRTLVFQIAAVMLLPLLIGTDGIWLSMVVAELFAALLALTFILAKRKRFGYLVRE